MKPRRDRSLPLHRVAFPTHRGFTLVEVVLALTIATGLLITALLFYRQATEIRGQILRESEINTAIRLVLERLAADLREAMVVPGDGGGFSGGPDSLSLVRGVPSDPASTNMGLVRVSFFAVKSTEGTNTAVVGVDRREQPLRGTVAGPRTNDVLADAFAVAPAGTNAVPAPAVRSQPILSEDIRHLRFRYWTGAAWTSVWDKGAPPTGVEIVLGPDPVEATLSTPVEFADAAPDPAASGDGQDASGIVLFRRVVFLPTGIASKHPADEAMDDPSSP